MSDDNNVVEFPSVNLKTVKNFDFIQQAAYDSYRESIDECLKTVKQNIDENKDITGVVCLTFDKSGTMQDLMAGDIHAANLYVMLDKVKMDVMSIISNAYEEIDE